MTTSPPLKSLLLLAVLITVNCLSFADYSDSASGTRVRSNDAFYDSLQTQSDRNWFLRTLYSVVFSPDTLDITIQVKAHNFEPWRGKTIRSILITDLEVFPLDSYSNSWKGYSLIAKAGNGLHLNTRRWVIRDNLFFREGDKLIPETLQRNLVYLHSLNYLSKVQILVVTAKGQPDSADVHVVYQDKFSLKLGGGISSQTQFRVNIADQNFLGLGQKLSTEWDIDTQRQGAIGWKLNSSIPNLGRTFITSELDWEEVPGRSWKSAVLMHPFLYPVKAYAGGVDISKLWVSAPVDSIEVDKVELGGWGGFSIPGFSGPANQYAYTALSVAQTWFRRRPQVGISEGKFWHESLLVMGALALTEADFRYLPDVFMLLENDEVPVGFLAEFLFGNEFGEFRDRQFLGIRCEWSNVFSGGGFLYLKGGLESFAYKNKLEQGVVVAEPFYISPIMKLGKINSRSYCRGKVIHGINRFPQETVKLSTNPYYRGNRDLSGSGLYSIVFEQELIAPWDLLGFHFSVFGFVDGAFVQNPTEEMNEDNVLWTEGLGIRIRNQRLVWNSIELHVAWNQGVGHFDTMKFVLSAKVPLQMLDFKGTRPQPYKFE